jgi:hypothetical protein
MKFRMSAIGPVVCNGPEKVAQDSLKPEGNGVPIGRTSKMHQKLLKTRGIRSFERFADHLINFFANGASFECPPGTLPLNLQLSNEVEMAELENPAILLGDFLHAVQVVDDKRSSSKPRFCWKSRKNLIPTESAFFSRKKDRVEKYSGFSSTRFDGDQKENPGPSAEVKTKTIGEKYQIAAWDFLGARLGHKALKCLSKSVTEVRQRYVRAPWG